jgi:hypothetical protein
MTQQEENLVILLENFNWNLNNVPVELVKSLQKVRMSLLRSNVTFTENNIPVMEYWEEFKSTGLNNIDYVISEYYKDIDDETTKAK